MGSILLYIAVLAIVIACLGLFGLALYNTEVRTKEIGVRKVFGSSLGNIVMRLSGNFTRWALIANAFAWPAAYFIFQKYIQLYAYRISLPLWIFLATSAGAYLIALLTISYQSFRAGSTNPADALRYE
jgi:putative ABC transport system permease protein